jgi:hypothetical protein
VSRLLYAMRPRRAGGVPKPARRQATGLGHAPPSGSNSESVSLNSVLDSVEALADACLENARGFETSPVERLDRGRLVEGALAFHARAGTLTAGVAAAAKAVLEGAPLVRFAHQPNLFMQFGLLGHFFAVDALAQALRDESRSLPAIGVYLVVDDDYADDRRFRVAHYPALGSATGTAVLSLPRPTHRFVMARIPAPSVDQVDRWLSTLRACIASDLARLKRFGWYPAERGLFGNRLSSLRVELGDVRASARSAVDFSTLHLSRLINLHFGLPVLFISLNALRPATAAQMSFLWEHYNELCAHAASLSAEAKVVSRLRFGRDDLPFWALCSCGTRLRLKPAQPGSGAVADCTSCGRHYRFGLMPRRPIDPELVSTGVLRPRVVFDDMLDSLALGAIGGVGYIGAASHASLARTILEQAGLPIVVDKFFRQTLSITGMTELLAAELNGADPSGGIDRHTTVLNFIRAGRISGVYATLSKGYETVRAGLQEHWGSSTPFESSVHFDDPQPMAKYPSRLRRFP